MCGIAGYYNLNGAAADVGTLAKMIDIQRHRGPDDQGMRMFSLFKGSSASVRRGEPPADVRFEGGLGFNRLSILDLSEHGHQPMLSRDGSVILAFNGEIYNAFDYIEELESSGFQFRSHTDTEVILYLYEKFGLDGMLSRLNGMFAIVIVDLRRQDIHIVRDHLGIKPIYWTICGSSLLFSSEVKSFLTHPQFSAQIDSDYIDEYLAFRYVCGENHLLKAVKQLRPGCFLRVGIDGNVRIHRYWTIADNIEKLAISRAEAVNRVDHLLRNAVESQLLSDVKVGCQLSGGIDSSLVSVFARSHFGADMDTFSVVFDDPDYSEEHWISEAATTANAQSHRFPFTDQVFFDTLERASWHLDQPLNHPNSLGIWLLAEKSRALVTVLLSGEGADELFGGYTRFYYANLRRKVSPWLPLLKVAPRIGQRLESHFGGDPVDSFISASLFLQPAEQSALRPEGDLKNAMIGRREIFAEGQSDHLSNCLKYEMQTYMVDLLVRQDKMTMAHSMENRVPFLDLNLVSFVRQLPPHCLVSESIHLRHTRMRGTKIVLKDLARRTFSDRFVFRPKSGFALPLTHYFNTKQFESLMEDRLLPGMADRGIVRPQHVRQLWKSPSKATEGSGETLWVAVALELWAQQVIDCRPAEGV